MFNFINNLNFLIMRKRILITALIAVSFLQISAQDAWKYLNPAPTENNLYSVWFTNEETGFTVGEAGTILKTEDHCYTWQAYDDLFGNNGHRAFGDVRFFNESDGYISGVGYINLKTTDGGSTWTEFPLGDIIETNLFTIYFHNDFQTGFIAVINENTNNIEIRKTTNGGTNWETKLDLGPFMSLHTRVTHIYFSDVNTGFVISYGTIYKTTDGGETWNTMLSLAPSYESSYTNLHFIDNNIGYVLENHKILKTTDGGLSWTTLAITDIELTDIKFFNDSCAVVACVNAILTSIDYGTTWQTLTTDVPALRDIHLLNQNLAYIVGDNGAILKIILENGTFTLENQQKSYSTIQPTYRHNQRLFGPIWYGYYNYNNNYYYSDNLGIDWLPCEGLPEYSTYSVEFFSDSVGYACTYPGSLYKSRDGGETWSLLYTHTAATSESCYFLNDTVGYMFQKDPSDYGTYKSTLMKTTDGGVTWNLIGSQLWFSVRDIYFSSEDTGHIMVFFSGMSQKILKTTDGGITWNTGYSVTMPSKFIPLNKDTIISVSKGQIDRTIDAGENWNTVTDAHNVRPFADFNENILYSNVSGANYFYRVSEDFGETWQDKYFNGIATFSAYYMYMTDANSGIAYRESKIITNGLLPLNYHVNAGSTGYCEGTEGVEIFMPKTEYIVNYTLLKNGVAQTTLLANGDTLSFGNQLAGVYTITSENENGITNLTDTIVITEIPTIGTAGIITGDEAVCMETSNSVYSVEPVAAASEYLWTLPSGFNISTGENTNEITVSVASGAVSGPITVQASNQCGQSNTQSFDVTISLTPTADFSADNTTILVNETITLTDASTDATSWLWTITPSTGVTFTGGTNASSQNPQISFANQGVYDVELKATGLCGENSELKNDYITVNILDGISETAKGNISVYPTPASTFISIETNSMELNSRIEIINIDGKVVYNGLLDNPTKKEINIENLNSGIYVIKITNNRSSKFVKFLVK